MTPLELTPDHLQAILPFLVVGFLAQLVDGALGMAFGVITSTLLVGVLGVPPARASASVHLVEAFTTAASGISHIVHRNVDWRLFARLALPGMAGGIGGAYLLSSVDGAVARPFVTGYLVLAGLYLGWRAWRMRIDVPPRRAKVVAPLGLVGGFLDAAGGGGWGPVVSSNLLLQGTDPRTTIGTVNVAEFALTVTISLAFLGTLGLTAFTTAAVGLIIGGLLAAPLGAVLAKRVPPRVLLGVVSVALVVTSSFGFVRSLG